MTPSIPAQATITLLSDTELLISREFNAPPALVWEAITRPEHVRNWYGMCIFTMDVCEIELRVGGSWRYVLRDPSGMTFAFSGEYLEIEPPGRLVSTERYEAIPNSDYRCVLTLTDVGGRTLFRNHLTYQSQAHRDGHLQSGMETGMNETYRRLDELLAGMVASAA